MTRAKESIMPIAFIMLAVYAATVAAAFLLLGADGAIGAVLGWVVAVTFNIVEEVRRTT